jgi:molecular chaperone GrpE
MEEKILEEEKEQEEKEIKEEAQEGERDLTAELEELKRKCEEYYDNWVRTTADFENYKKRVQREKEEFIEYGNETILRDFLPIIDNLERALNFMKESPNPSSIIEGVELIYKQMMSLLEKYGVRPIEALGKKFDPFYHEVVEQRLSEEEDGVVLQEYQKGYMYKTRVLRPSLVVVSKKIEKGEEKKEEREGSDGQNNRD